MMAGFSIKGSSGPFIDINAEKMNFPLVGEKDYAENPRRRQAARLAAIGTNG
jgi:hypothetical protein